MLKYMYAFTFFFFLELLNPKVILGFGESKVCALRISQFTVELRCNYIHFFYK